MQFRSIFALAVTLLFTASVHAQQYRLGNLQIQNPYARATVPNQPSGAAYLGIENTGKDGDRLIGISSPIAKTVQIHTMSMDGNVMKMREVPNIDIAPSAAITMKPGSGYHIMLIGLNGQLKAGDKFPLTLKFEKSGKIDVSVMVEDKGAKSLHEAGMQHGH